MTAARIITALPAVCVAGALLVLAVLLLAEARRLRRTATAAERAARPHSVNAATAVQDAAALMTARLHEEEQAFLDLHGLTPARPVDTITVKGTYL